MPQYQQLIATPRRNQRGLTLIESLVAIFVTALGILGILGVQMRTLADTQTTVRRAQAIRLIEDLGERMKVQPNALANLDAYVIGWGTATGTPPLTPQAGSLCDSSACTTGQLAAYDIREWKRQVERSLPLADANVFVAPGDSSSTDNRRQLGVMISWRENEKSTDTDYTTSLNAAADGGTDVTCPANRTCHLQYIPLAARCAPYLAGGGGAQYYCAGS
ncbi:type IV pilus modification protein PilV [Ottowia sp.]|uniref:type IV pilus modification protein PilV n=1 Tax=Ottowia sp. TaxID=1898956 RepID=UPI0039E4A7DC